MDLLRKGIEHGGDFVVVWEARRTREVMIKGFKTLEEATHRIGDKMNASMSRLERSVSNNVARKVIDEIHRRQNLK